jgi:hypothetical protein
MRFDEFISAALDQADEACDALEDCRDNVIPAFKVILPVVWPKSLRDNQLAQADQLVLELLKDTINRAKARENVETLKDIPSDRLGTALEIALRDVMIAHELPAEPVIDPIKVLAAYPLGVLASDHVGYLSFDLTRLPDQVFQSILKAIQVLRIDPSAQAEATIWVYPFSLLDLRFDALAQRRFSNDAIVMRLALDPQDVPFTFHDLGLLAMQNPTLTDWRLSPGSFASQPNALLGEDGCELLFPANVALHEYNFYQVIGLTDPDAQPPNISQDMATLLKAGFVNEYRLSWIPLGHSLGQILQSFPLAPGESVNLAIIDWSRQDEAVRAEETKIDESLFHELHRDRTISETVRAAIDEWQRGGNVMGGAAASYGQTKSMGQGALGEAFGISGSLGGAYSTSSGSRDITVDTVQKLSDNVIQQSTASRELHSTVVVQTKQTENERIETRTIVNYNHSHALTFLYYEVLRHFRLVTEFVRRRPVLLVKMDKDWFGLLRNNQNQNEEEKRKELIRVLKNIVRYRGALVAYLLDDRFAGSFDAVERKIRWESSPKVPPPAHQPIKLRYFTFYIKTGGRHANPDPDKNEKVNITAALFAQNSIELVNQASAQSTILNPWGSFSEPNTVQIFTAMPRSEAKWDDFDGIGIGIGLKDTTVSIAWIKIEGQDENGNIHTICERDYKDGHLVFFENAQITLPLLRPPAPPPAPAPSVEEVEDDVKVAELLDHLRSHQAHYNRAILLHQNAAERAQLLNEFQLPASASLLSYVENRPLEILGNFVAYPLIDPEWSKPIEEAMKVIPPPEPRMIERLATLPTRGVFAEAKLSHCNASEEIDNTRFWDWQSSPIPHMAPEIAPIQAVTPQPQQQNLAPTPFPASLLNIVNPPNAPDPTGMAAVLSALTTPNIFRDMSGRAEVADLLKELTQASVDIAGVANKSREIQAKYGKNLENLDGQGRTPSQSAPRSDQSTPGQATPEQREAQALANQEKKLDMGRKYLPPPMNKEVQEQAKQEMTKKKTQWHITLTSEWSGEMQAPMRASYDCDVYIGNLVDDRIQLLQYTTDEVVHWQVELAKKPIYCIFKVSNITPPDGSFKVIVPLREVPGLPTSLKKMDYTLPLRDADPRIPIEMKYALNGIRADTKNPELDFHGTGTLGTKTIKITAKVNAEGELTGGWERAFEAAASIEKIANVGITATLTGAVRVMIGAEVGVEATFEIIYLKGYEVKQLVTT